MASAGRPRGFGSDPPTGSSRAGLGGRHTKIFIMMEQEVVMDLIVSHFEIFACALLN